MERTVAWEQAAFAAADVAYTFRPTVGQAGQRETLARADVVLTSGPRWTADTFITAPRCHLLVNCGVGLDRVDVATATAAGVMVCNMPDLCTDEVADHTLALLLALVRKVPRLNRRVVAGIWDHVLLEPMPCPRGKTLGLLGFGRVGRAVAERARAFGLQCAAYDPYLPPAAAEQASVPLLALDDLLASSDIISCHLPLAPETTNLLGAAALDVVAAESPPADHPLLALEQVIVTPHAAGFSNEVVDRIPQLAVQEALAVLAGGRPRAVAWVNPHVRVRPLVTA